jgi:hypothetical protein
MQYPQTAGDLLQFISASQWFADSVPRFEEAMSPLRRILEGLIKGLPKRTKRAASRIPITCWTESEYTAFNDVRAALVNAVTLACPDPAKVLYVFLDASRRYWNIVITQVPTGDIGRPHALQLHEPIAFHGGEFKN